MNWTSRDLKDDRTRYQLAAFYFKVDQKQNGIDSLCEALLLNGDNAQMIFDHAPELKGNAKIEEIIQLYTKEL